MSDETERTAIVVLGAHRSGTSALTRVVSLWGATLPRDLMLPNHGNPAGYWESEAVAALNDRVLEALGSRWDDFRPVDRGALPPGTLESYQSELEEVLASVYGDASRIVLKDPRLCRLVEPADAVLSRLGFSVRYLLVHREPLDVIASLMRREGMTSGLAALIWLRHQLDAEAATRDRKRAVISFGALLDDWRGVARQAAEALAVDWPDLESAGDDVDRFLALPARGDRDAIAELEEYPVVRVWVERARVAFESLACASPPTKRSASDEIGDSETRSILDAVRDDLDRVASVASVVLAERRSLERRIDAHRRTLKSHEARSAPLEDGLEEARQTVEELGERIEVLSRQVRELEDRERQLQGELEDARRRNARLSDDVGKILGSNSWRLTRPLRALRRVIRRRDTRGSNESESAD